MLTGPLPQRKLPKQDIGYLTLMASRFERSAHAQQPWAEVARKCVDFNEGVQWSEADKKYLESAGRPALTWNKIAPLTRLVYGFHVTNRTDIRYLVSGSGDGLQSVAEALTHLQKQASTTGGLMDVEGEVYLDGMLTGRGYYDVRIDFQDNDLGEIKYSALDPFATYLDPDGDQYDLNMAGYVCSSKMVSLMDVEANYGSAAAAVVQPLISPGAHVGVTGITGDIQEYIEEITPWRKFGGDYVNSTNFMIGEYESAPIYYLDRHRQSIRVIDMQSYERISRLFFIDLRTGDKIPIPDHWDDDRIRRVMEVGAERGEDIDVQRRMDRRIRWTHVVGDVIVWDSWSPYETFTVIPFFPYFRRGRTRGMVEDLLDPQTEINKRRSAYLNIVNRTANSGWMYREGSLDPEQAEALRKFGALPGNTLEYRGDRSPEQIDPSPPPLAMERLEDKANSDMKEISGINEAVLGQLDKAISGKAVEARQRQAVIALEGYQENLKRSQKMLGMKSLNLFQRFYTEERISRVTGDNGQVEEIVINKRDPSTGEILNNVTLGKYGVAVDTTAMSATFQAAQFDEVMEMVKQGIIPPEAADIIIDMSSLPRKEEFKQRIQQLLGLQQQQQAEAAAASVPGAAIDNAAIAAPPIGV